MKIIVCVFLLLIVSACNESSESTVHNRRAITKKETPESLLQVSKTKDIQSYDTKDQSTIFSLAIEIPETKNKKAIINHSSYSLLYSEKHEQALWIAYELTSEETNRMFERSNKFTPDFSVKTGSANDQDYKGSGYDRGHLAPAADMSFSQRSMQESFYYSNISPQDPSFNRGIWKRLESLVRDWAVINKSLYVVTGPVLTQGLNSIGRNSVSIPNYYYKVILDYRNPELKAIGFIIPNIGLKGDLSSFSVSVDKVEEITGLNFFSAIPDEQENYLESSVCISCWSWKASSTNKNPKKKDGSSQAVQCSGITKKGLRCKRRVLDPSGFCFQHQ